MMLLHPKMKTLHTTSVRLAGEEQPASRLCLTFLKIGTKFSSFARGQR